MVARGSLRSSISLFVTAVLMGVLACDSGTEDGGRGSPDDAFSGRRKPPLGAGGTGWGGGGKDPGTGGTGGEGGATTPPPSCGWLCAEAEAGCDARLQIPDCEQRCEGDSEFAGCLEAFCAPDATTCPSSSLCEEACENTYLGCGIQLTIEWDYLTQTQCAILCDSGLLGYAQATCLAELVCGRDLVENFWLVDDCLASYGSGGDGGYGGDGGTTDRGDCFWDEDCGLDNRTRCEESSGRCVYAEPCEFDYNCGYTDDYCGKDECVCVPDARAQKELGISGICWRK